MPDRCSNPEHSAHCVGGVAVVPGDPAVDTQTTRRLEQALPEQIQRPVILRMCDEIETLRAWRQAVLDLCDNEEQNARRNRVPVPSWVHAVREAAVAVVAVAAEAPAGCHRRRGSAAVRNRKQPPAGFTAYTLPLVPDGGRRAHLELPDDLTAEEATRVGRFVRSVAALGVTGDEDTPDA